MELRQLAYFLAAAQTQNFSKAAVLCLVAQPALSRQVASLERELGVELFRREKQRVKLTAAGQEFITYAKSALDAAQQGQQMLVKLQEGLKGTVRVGSVASLATALLPQVFATFHKQYPSVSLQVKVSKAEQLVHLVEQEEIDLGLTLDPIIQSDIVVSKELFRQPLYALVPVDHPLTRIPREECTLERIVAEPIIMLDEASRVRIVIEQLLRQRGLSVQPVIEMDSLGGVSELIRLGCGITLIPPALLRPDPDLTLIPIMNLSAKFIFAIVYRRFGNCSRSALQFINQLTRDASIATSVTLAEKTKESN
jgi:Transcriptional regulator